MWSSSFLCLICLPPPASRRLPPHRDNNTHRDNTHRDNTHTEITHTEITHTETTHITHTQRSHTHRDNTHRDHPPSTPRQHVQRPHTETTHTQRQHTPRRHRQRSHTQRSHTPEFVAGAALCEPPCSVRGCGCCVVCGCRRWSPVRPSIVIRVFTCLLTCRVRGRRSTL